MITTLKKKKKIKPSSKRLNIHIQDIALQCFRYIPLKKSKGRNQRSPQHETINNQTAGKRRHFHVSLSVNTYHF